MSDNKIDFSVSRPSDGDEFLISKLCEKMPLPAMLKMSGDLMSQAILKIGDDDQTHDKMMKCRLHNLWQQLFDANIQYYWHKKDGHAPTFQEVHTTKYSEAVPNDIINGLIEMAQSISETHEEISDSDKMGICSLLLAIVYGVLHKASTPEVKHVATAVWFAERDLETLRQKMDKS